MNEKIISAADMMLQAANINIDSANEICSIWKKVVSGVHSSRYESENSEKRMPIGERLAGNTRVIDLKNGVLLVETDHPGWIQYLRMYQKFIIKGLNMNLPDLKISTLAFRVTGQKVNLSESYNNQIQNERKKIETIKKLIEKYNLSPENTLYMGDDINDIECLQYVTFPVTVNNAHNSVKSIENIFITQNNGGKRHEIP